MTNVADLQQGMFDRRQTLRERFAEAPAATESKRRAVAEAAVAERQAAAREQAIADEMKGPDGANEPN